MTMRLEWQEVMKNFKPTPAVFALHILWSFVIGIATIWLYAAIRSR